MAAGIINHCLPALRCVHMQASRAQRSADLMAGGTSVYYSLPAGLRPSRHAQQGPLGAAAHSEPNGGQRNSGGGEVLLSYEDAGAALLEAVRENFSWGEQVSRVGPLRRGASRLTQRLMAWSNQPTVHVL